MKLTKIMQEVYCKPWLIRPAMHKQICDIVQAHVSGEAHMAGGIADAFAENEPKDILSYCGECAVVDVQGVIGRKVGNVEKSSGVTDINDVADALVAGADGSEGIILRIDSPGGTVSGVPEVAMLIKELGEETPIVAYVDGQAASAGYWLASQAHAIVGGMSADVGSVGVYMSLLDQSRAAEMAGLKVEVIKAGRYKGIGIPGTPLTEDQRNFLQGEVNKVYEMFKGAVRMSRGAIEDDVLQGQDFMGEDAVRVGLMDEIGGMDKALELVRFLKR